MPKPRDSPLMMQGLWQCKCLRLLRHDNSHLTSLTSAWSSNMLVKTVQTEALGWKPKHKVTEDDVVDGLDDGLSRLSK